MGSKENWNRLLTWWGDNAKSNEKKLSAGFSWLLVILVGALTVPLIATVQGDVPNWSAFLVIVIGAIAGFLIMVIEAIFGKKEAPTGTPIVLTESVEIST